MCPISIDNLTDRKHIRSHMILAVLENEPNLAFSTKELADFFSVAESTITRSLKLLMQQKKVKKAYQKGVTNAIPFYYVNPAILLVEESN